MKLLPTNIDAATAASSEGRKVLGECCSQHRIGFRAHLRLSKSNGTVVVKLRMVTRSDKHHN
jgi:hypothetical protein